MSDVTTVLSTDLDDTLIGDDAALERFIRATSVLRNAGRLLLVYNAGRKVHGPGGIMELISEIPCMPYPGRRRQVIRPELAPELLAPQWNSR